MTIQRHHLAAALLTAALSATAWTPSSASPPKSAPGPSATPGGVIVWENASSFDTIDSTVNLLVANADGTGQRQLTAKQEGVADSDPTISPDGTRVLFSRNTEDGAELRIVPVAGGPSVAIPMTCGPSCIGWDKGTWLSNHRVAFTWYSAGDQYPQGYRGPLYSVRTDGTGLRRLSPRGRDGRYEEMYARLAPDRSYVVFLRARTDESGESAIVRMRPDGTQVRRLTPWNLLAYLPHLSPARSGPTADLVAFQSYGEGNPTGTSRDILTVPARCATRSACDAAIAYLTHNGMGTGRSSNPAWSPDGRYLVYADRPSEDEIDCQIVTMAVDGSDRHTVSTSPYFDYRPDWGRG